METTDKQVVLVVRYLLDYLGYVLHARRTDTMPNVGREILDVLQLDSNIYWDRTVPISTETLLHEVGHALGVYLAGRYDIMIWYGAHWIVRDPSSGSVYMSDEEVASACAVWLCNKLKYPSKTLNDVQGGSFEDQLDEDELNILNEVWTEFNRYVDEGVKTGVVKSFKQVKAVLDRVERSK